jgi:hypothetical protein
MYFIDIYAINFQNVVLQSQHMSNLDLGHCKVAKVTFRVLEFRWTKGNWAIGRNGILSPHQFEEKAWK